MMTTRKDLGHFERIDREMARVLAGKNDSPGFRSVFGCGQLRAVLRAAIVADTGRADEPRTRQPCLQLSSPRSR